MNGNKNGNKILILDTEIPNSLAFLTYYHSLNYGIFAGSPHHFPISLFSRVPVIKYHYPPTGYLIDYGELGLIDQAQTNFFISSLTKFLEKNKIRHLISLSETTLIPILLNINRLNLEEIYPEYAVIEKLHDKSLLFKRLGKISIKSFFLPSVYSPQNLKFPCFVRPAKGMGSKHGFLCKNMDEFNSAVKALRKLGRDALIQEYIPTNNKFALNLLVDKKGRIVRLLSPLKISKRKIRTLLRCLEGIFKRIGYFGFASPQFLVYNDNLYLAEINPRLSVNLYGLDFGVNFPEGFHKLFIEEKRPKKIFKFIPMLPDFIHASKIYLQSSHDIFPVLKSVHSLCKGTIRGIFTE